MMLSPLKDLNLVNSALVQRSMYAIKLFTCFIIISCVLNGCVPAKKVADGCESPIPGYEMLSIPEGLGAIYPGQVIVDGIYSKGSISSQEVAQVKAGGVDGTSKFDSDVKTEIAGTLQAKFLKLFESELKNNKIKSIDLKLNSLKTIVGSKEQVYTYPSNAIVVKNLLMADITAIIKLQDSLNVNVSLVKEKIEGEFKASFKNQEGNSTSFSSEGIVVGVQSFEVQNETDSEYKGSVGFTLLEKYNRKIVVDFDPTTELPVRSEIVMNLASMATGDSIRLVIDVFGSGAPPRIEKELSISNLLPFSLVVPASGQNSAGKFIIYTFDPTVIDKSRLKQYLNDGNSSIALNDLGEPVSEPLKIGVTRSLKSAKKVTSGLSVVCKNK